MSESTEIGPYLVWMWQHYSLSLFPCETLEEAVGLSEAIQDAGNGSTECIEGPEGVVSDEVVERLVRARDEAREAESASTPPLTHGIVIKSPSGDHAAAWSSYTSRDEAEAALASLRVRFGDRAVIREYRS